MNLAQVCELLSRRYGWTVAEIMAMTYPQVILYLFYGSLDDGRARAGSMAEARQLRESMLRMGVI